MADKQVLGSFDVPLPPFWLITDVEHPNSCPIKGFFQLINRTRLESRSWLSSVAPIRHSVAEVACDIVKAKPTQIRANNRGIRRSFRHERD
jgi:hypothetical protein